jgi:Tol biopolymer transport system component
MRKILVRIFVFLLLCGFVGMFVYRYFSDQVKMNTTYVNGNTAGNLYNAGLFCENNGTVFFANPDDNNRLYSMDVNGSNLKKLSNDTATYINADSHYVYYIRDNDNSSLDYSYFSFHNNSL